MESIKDVSELSRRDTRNKNLVLVHASGQVTKITSKRRLYDIVITTRLHSGVPMTIVDHFSQAQNLTLYAWYNFPFHSSAQLLALASLEMALRYRLKSKGMLSSLLKRAIDEEGIITEDFLAVAMAPAPAGSLCKTVKTILPQLRNGYAHGSDALNPFSIPTIRLVSAIINILFEIPASAA